MKKLKSFLNRLQEFEHTDTVFNPYKCENAVNNLRIYLELLISTENELHMLIGEAPGYKGCRITGIPFTSSEFLIKTENPWLIKIKDKLHFSEVESENTANFMWQCIEELDTTPPLLWNSFPFHPHIKGNPKSNRAPKATELKLGITYLAELYDLLKPAHMASIGRKGEQALKLAFPEQPVIYIRHPSYGGKNDFIKGMQKFMK